MRKKSLLNKTLFPLVYLLPASLFAAPTVVHNQTELNNALQAGVDIQFANDITVNALILRPVNTLNTFAPNNISITIDGEGFTYNQGIGLRNFFVRGGTVQINNLNFTNGTAAGGIGGNSSGGGGAGMGGGLFIGAGATVSLLNPTFTSCSSTGGVGGMQTSNGPAGGGGIGGPTPGNLSGGAAGNATATAGQFAGGGGGGFNGTGGIPIDHLAKGGGGGGCNPSVGGGIGTDASGGTGGGDFSGAGGGTAGNPGASGAGGGGGSVGAGGAGGIGGGGGGAYQTAAGGPGGSYAGGGGGNSGGNGGYGGGAGAGFLMGTGGLGGFGAGGGGNPSQTGLGGLSVFSGGAGDLGGGGGAGLGGALFIQGVGSGSLTPGKLTIQINSSYTGNLFAGSSVVAGAGNNGGGNGGAAGIDIFMESSGQLTFDISDNIISLLNSIEGDQAVGGNLGTTGGLIKKGNGLLQLTGANTYTGLTEVQVGELNIQGSVLSELQVDPGALLSGNFTAIKNTLVNPNSGNLTNSGTVSPGGLAVGQIDLQGNYVQNASGTLLVDITPTGEVSDKLFMTMGGTATLAGTLNIVVDDGNYLAGTSYTIINAPVTGTFSSVVQSGAQAGNVQISVTYSSVVVTVLNNLLFTHQNIQSGIPKKVATALTNATITPGSDLATVVEVLGTLTDPEVNAALSSMAPTNFGAVELASARNNSYIAYLLSKHLVELPCSPRDCCQCGTNSAVWVTGFTNLMNNYEKFDNLTPYDANAGGILAGADYCWEWCGALYLGAALGYTHTEINFKNKTMRGWSNSYYGALYGSYTGDYFSVDASVLGGGNNENFRRHMSFGIINRIARSDPSAWFVTGHLGISSDWTWCDWKFEPFALADYHYFHTNGFKEKGAMSINLVTKANNEQILRGEAGMIFSRDWMYDCCACFSPYIGLSWVGEFPLESIHEKAHFVDQSAAKMNITSYHSSIQLASPQAGFKWSYRSGFSLDLGYKGLYNSKTSINEVEGRLEWVF